MSPKKKSVKPSLSIEELQEQLNELKVELEIVKENQNDLIVFLEKTPDFVYIKDHEYKFKLTSNSFARFTKHENWKELVGKTDFDIFPRKQAKKYFQYEQMVVEKGISLIDHEEAYHSSKGEKRWMITSKVPIYDDNGTAIRGLIGISKDITKRKIYEEEIKFLAKHDALTGLPNRILFNELANQQIKMTSRKNINLAVLFIDLDHFKATNDEYGHKVGDIVLKKIAKRLKQALREVDIIARYGGDEFLVLLSDYKDKSDLKEIKARILEKVELPIWVGRNRFVHISCSIGESVFSNRDKNIEQLLLESDKSMYKSKQSKKFASPKIQPEILTN